MNNDNISLDDLIEALSSDFETLKQQPVESRMNLQSLLEWNSLNSLLITVKIKQVFGVELLPGELRGTQSFEDLLPLINNKRPK